jgi:hypothetical protein
MKRALLKFVFALFGLTALAVVLLAEQSPSVLGKINFAALFDAAPVMPASTAEAGKRVYGPEIAGTQAAADLTPFYEPFNKRIVAAHDVLQPAIAARPAKQDAMGQQAMAQAANNPIVAGMGGMDKIQQMSEDEQEKAAMQALGNYQQGMAGGNTDTSNGMQAVMQRVMNDPAYRDKFEKMTPQEQEAEMRKAMGPSAHVAQHSAADDQRSAQASTEMAPRVARHNEISALLQRMLEIDTEFDKKEKAIAGSPGNHDQIVSETKAKIAKLPIVHIAGSEMSYDGPDPVKLKVLHREQATLDHARAASELQQRTALFAERKSKYKELAASYATWLKQSPGGTNMASANMVNDFSDDAALSCEEQLIKLAESLRRYHEDSTRNAAMYEQLYQQRMAEK